MSDTPTPRCDAAKWKGHAGDLDWQEVVSLHEAVKLELELKASQEREVVLREAIENWMASGLGTDRDDSIVEQALAQPAPPLITSET